MSAPAIIMGADLSLPSDEFETLTARIAARVSACPHGTLRSYDAGGNHTLATYPQLWHRAGTIAAGLSRYGVEAGRPVALMIFDVVDYVPAFWACLRAGNIVIPLSGAALEPAQQRRDATLRSVVAQLDRPVILADHYFLGFAAVLARETGAVVIPLAHAAELAGDWTDQPPADPLCLLPTSGTTGDAKLVALGQTALLYRYFSIGRVAATQPVNVLCGFPIHGISGLRVAFLCYRHWVQMPAAALAGHPLTLLDATESLHIARWFITNSLAAAVLAAVERSPRCWDLGALRQVDLGGETVQPEIARRLSDLLARHGAMAVAIRCGYGTTETGPLVTGADALAASGLEDGALALGGCAPGVALRIVGPRGEGLLEGQVGKVHAFCPKVMFSCYWRAPEGDDGSIAGGWWDTGDLGQLRGGQLILNGRSKETINVHGKKYALAEIDGYLQSAIGPGVRAHACAVHWPGRPTETLAVAYVADGRQCENRTAIAEAIRLAVTRRFALQASPIIALTADQIPLTGSGKLRRLELAARLRRGDFGSSCRQDALPAPDGDEPFVNAAAVHGPIETAVAVTWTEVAGSEAFLADLPLERSGVDSVKLLTVIFRIELILGRKIPFDLLRADMTPSMLISEIGRLGEGQRLEGNGPGTEPIGGPLDHDLPADDLPEVVAEVVNHSRKPGATLADRIRAATLLIVFGYVERARAILSALPSQPAVGQTEMLRLCDRLDVGRQLLLPGRQEELDAMVSHNPRAKRVVLIFPGQGGRFWGFNEPVFLYRDEASIVFMRDTGEFHYLHGMRGLGTTYADCLDALRTIVRVIGGGADRAAMPLHCMGHSTGAYAALRFGVDLRADSILAFSGPTNLDIGDQSESIIRRPQVAALRVSAPGMAADLRSLYAAATHPPKVLICFGADHPQDAAAARHMAGLPGVLLRPIVGFGGHDTLGEAMRLKCFEALVDEMQMHVPHEWPSMLNHSKR